MPEPLDLDGLRALFPICEQRAYLNNAGVAPPSVAVRDAVLAFVDDLLHHGVHGESGWEAVADGVRAAGARLLGCGAHEIALVPNTSQGLGLVAEGLPWRDGDEVVVCAALEYPSNVYPWLHLRSRGVVVRDVAPGGAPGGAPGAGGGATRADGVTPDAVAAAMGPRTRVVAVSAVQYATGHRTDLAALGALCRRHGAFLVVDGIQQVGAVPLDVKACGIHALSADSHKWMLGLPGAGLLYVDEDLVGRLRPPLVGWKSTTDAWNFDRVHFELRADAARLEPGSPGYPVIYGMGAALDLLERVGHDVVADRVLGLVASLDDRLRGLGLRTSPPAAERAGILMVEVPDGSAGAVAVAERCEAAGVSISARRGRLRVSPHAYNTEADLDALVAVLAGLR